ncbi:hypothetical protein DACRYDRAFT_25371 [Dacryopinax primogenitus]|uniref:Sulfhydryl oxidase n=1 Tax=Dacryopinax primogenitus (strain DJM 731) TaxID=1858805 RepID=M5FZK9_DACPD|nr:uncharacterized protein DACRYDRAFT_25371 [Dacryopinax primogenitus]EJT96937.1 hypothetical protein DACRYDRAFT_25371 [Dacryopinax primogenitus]
MLSRFTRVFLAISFLLILALISVFFNPPVRTYFDPWTGIELSEGGVEHRGSDDMLDLERVMTGDVIMGKLANETAKAELGRAAWRVLHLVTLRYPEKPTPDQRDTLKSFFYVFARLYPCGQCAQEFQQLLKQYPPQTSSRRSASLWLCHVHNQVNKRLHKPEFDCSKLDETYDCGCGTDPDNPDDESTPLIEGLSKDRVTNEALQKGGIGI